jgi:hypothetical protein
VPHGIYQGSLPAEITTDTNVTAPRKIVVAGQKRAHVLHCPVPCHRSRISHRNVVRRNANDARPTLFHCGNFHRSSH